MNVYANSHLSVSPTPFWEFFDVEVGTGTQRIQTDSSTVYSYCASETSGASLSPSFVYFPASADWYTRRQGVDVGEDFVTTLIDELAESGTTIPGLESCTIRNGEGAPRVHVAVTALTDHSSTTERRNGIFPTSGLAVTNRPEITPAPQPTRPAPETTQPPVETTKPAPVEQPAPPAQTNVPQPPPSNGNSPQPPPSNGNPQPQPSNGNAPQPQPSNGNSPQPQPSNGNAPQPQPSNGNAPQPQPSNGNAPQPQPSNGNSPQPPPSNGNAPQPQPSNGNAPQPSNGNAPQPAPSNGNAPQPPPSNGNVPPARPTQQPAPILAPSLTLGTTVLPVTAIGTSTNGGIVVGGSTLLPSAVVTFQDQTLSLGPSGTNLVVVGTGGPSTVPLFVPGPEAAPAVTGNPQPAGSIVIGTQTIPLSPPSNTGQGVVLPGGTTLAPGSVVTFEGQTLSLASGGSSLVVLSPESETTIGLYAPAATTAAQETVLNVGSSSYTVSYATASEGGVILPGDQTLLPGSTTVIDGTTLSLGPQGTELVVGTSTVPLEPPQTTSEDASTTDPAGSYIWSGIGGGNPTSTPAEFTAGAGRSVDGWRSGAGFVAVVIAIHEVVFY
jgi:hypothetical protein